MRTPSRFSSLLLIKFPTSRAHLGPAQRSSAIFHAMSSFFTLNDDKVEVKLPEGLSEEQLTSHHPFKVHIPLIKTVLRDARW
jgi:hypothetical protein